MFNYKLPNGVPVKNVLKAIVTSQPSHSAHSQSQSQPSPNPLSAGSVNEIDTASAYDGIYPDDELGNQKNKVDPYRVYEHGESGANGEGKEGKWDEDGDEGDWGEVIDSADECFGK